MENQQVKKSSAKGVQRLKELWPGLTMFERFEYVVMLFVSVILMVIILVALYQLVLDVYQLVMWQVTHKSVFHAFQSSFGKLLTLLIAFEFRNSIDAMLEGKGLLVQVKIVLLIALMALARKFLVVDSSEMDANMAAAHAVIALSLGVVYWLLCRRESEDKDLVCR